MSEIKMTVQRDLRASTPVMFRLKEIFELLQSNRQALEDLEKAPSLSSWIRASVCRAYGFKTEKQ